MTCKNHPAARAKRRCFGCKSRICPACQHRAHRHIFCSADCAQLWHTEAQANTPEQLKISKQLDQVLDLTDAALDKNRSELGAQLTHNLLALEGDLAGRLQQMQVDLSRLVQGLEARLQQIESRIDQRHSSQEQLHQQQRQSLDDLAHVGDQKIGEHFSRATQNLDRLLNETRLQLNRGLELSRERLAQLLTEEQQQNQRFIAEQMAELQQRSEAGVQQRLSDLQRQLQTTTAEVREQLQLMAAEDLKRAATEVHFLDRFLERFRTIAEEQRREFVEMLKLGDQRLSAAIGRAEEQAHKMLGERAGQTAQRLDATLKELRLAIGERLKLLPRHFRLSPAAWGALTALFLAALASPMLIWFAPPAPRVSTNISGNIAVAAVQEPLKNPPSPPQPVHDHDHTLPVYSGNHIRPAAFTAHNVINGDRQRKQLALTFDGGSNSLAANAILDLLRSKRVQTTIFLTGEFILAYPEITRRIVADGHEVGNHTWSHPNLTTQEMPQAAKREFVRKQLLDTEKLFFLVTGKSMVPLWRAPFGAYNEETLRVARELGYTHVYWTDDTRDWVAEKNHSLYLTAEQIKQRLLAMHKRPQGASGGIVLMHLGSERAEDDQPYKLLPEVIDDLRGKGYEFVRVSQLIK